MPIFKGVKDMERLPAHIQSTKPIDFRSVTGFSSKDNKPVPAAGRAPVVATRDFDELVSQQRDASFLDKLIKKDKNSSGMRTSAMENSVDRIKVK